jgi:hypothetical protein
MPASICRVKVRLFDETERPVGPDPAGRFAQESPMKAAFALILVALLVIPAAATVRIMLWREKQRQRNEDHPSQG